MKEILVVSSLLFVCGMTVLITGAVLMQHQVTPPIGLRALGLIGTAVFLGITIASFLKWN